MTKLIWVLSMTVLGTILALLVTLRMAGAETVAETVQTGISSALMLTEEQLLDSQTGLSRMYVLLVDKDGNPLPVQYDRNGILKINLNHCLAQMEAAMRAWDKFVTYGLTMPPREDIPERAHAIGLWDATKAQCWRTP